MGPQTFEQKLSAVHNHIRTHHHMDGLGRVAVASYDEDTDRISVFAFSDLADTPLRLYSTELSTVPSLVEVARLGQARVIADLDELRASGAAHNRAIHEHYRSSLTVPIKRGKRLYGFVFFNSDRVGFFTQAVLERLLPYGQLLAVITVANLDRIKTLKAAVQTAREIGNMRDDETAAHLSRMAAYTRLIAVALAPARGFTERWIDMVTHFAPLHDVGKIAVPDKILFKPGKLDPEEITIMRSHVDAGVRIVDALVNNFSFDDDLFGVTLRNIVGCHHETLDGKGYPAGLAGDEIPIEARIVAVADIFDALTSERPYKHAWTIDEAIRHMRSIAGTKLDAECIEALVDNLDQVKCVMRHIDEVQLFADVAQKRNDSLPPFPLPTLGGGEIRAQVAAAPE